MLFTSMAFTVCEAQNILANPGFSDVFTCCEYKALHVTGWFYAGYQNSSLSKGHNKYLNVALYNDSNEYYSVTFGSLIKPLRKGQTYKLRMRFDRRETFYLYYGSFKGFLITSEYDTAALSSVSFDKVLVKNKSHVDIEFTANVDSADHIAFRFQSIQNLDYVTGSLYIDYIELTDPTEKKDPLNTYYQRVREIYREKRIHNFTKPCGGDKTLR